MSTLFSIYRQLLIVGLIDGHFVRSLVDDENILSSEFKMKTFCRDNDIGHV